MIIALFHVLYLFGKFVYHKYYDKQKTTAETHAKCADEQLNFSLQLYTMMDPEQSQNDGFYDTGPKFSPPAYLQRYLAVKDVLTESQHHTKLRKIVDFGCSELGFLRFLKNINGVEEILCVDTDRVTLEIHKKKAEPLFCEYLHNRNTPLVVRIFEGSVTHNDKILENVEAVTCIELIEHLYPDTLTDFPYNIFGYIKPQVAIVTTPNADFNVLFPNFSGFRHNDHKFEWTREQFQDWAENITLRYPEYKVTFQGICYGPKGTESLGACSQMAIFRRENVKNESFIPGVEGYFKEVATFDYPFRIDNRSDEQKIIDEATFYIRTLSIQCTEMTEEVPLQRVLEMLDKFNISLDTLRTILAESQWAVVDRENGPVVLIPPLSWSDHTDGRDEDFLSNYDPDEWEDEVDLPLAPLDYHYRRLVERDYNSENLWAADSLDDEIRIVMPLNNSSFNQSYSYLYNGEPSNEGWEGPVQRNPEESQGQINSSSQIHDGRENVSRDHELPSDSLSLALDQIDLEGLNASLTSNVPLTFASPIVLSSFPSSSRSETTQNVTESVTIDSQMLGNQSIISLSAEDTSEFGQFQPRMSISCVSTSPPRLYIHSTRTNSFYTDDSIMEYGNDTAFDSHSMNSTFNQNDLENSEYSMDNTNREENQPQALPRGSNENRLLLKGNSESENFRKTDCCAALKEGNQIDGQYDIDDGTSVMSGSSSTSDDQPRFASSPKMCTKKLYKQQDNKQCEDLLNKEEYGKSYDAHLLNINHDFMNHPQVSLQNVSMSTTSSDSCNTSDKWYENEDHSMYQTDFVTFKRENDTAYKLCDTNTSISDVSMQEINEKHEACPSGSQDDQGLNFTLYESQSKKFDLFLTKTQTTLSSPDAEKNLPVNLDAKKCYHEENTLVNLTAQGSDNILVYPCAKERRDAMSLCIEKDSFSDTQFTSYFMRAECSVPKERKLCEIGESAECKPISPADLETPPDSWSPEIMDSGYPNSASAQDMTTPEYDLSSIAHDRISDSESPSVAEAPRLGFPEPAEVENGDLANNNRDGEGNNMIAMEINLQPLLDVIENDLENENDIYAVENGFPVWLLRILEMANPADLDGHVQLADVVDRAAGGDAVFENVDQDEGFDSTSSDNDSDDENEMGNMIRDMDNNDNHDIGNDTDSSGDSLHAWAAGDT